MLVSQKEKLITCKIFATLTDNMINENDETSSNYLMLTECMNNFKA